MRRKKKERRGWRKKEKRKPALPNAIPGFVAVYASQAEPSITLMQPKVKTMHHRVCMCILPS
jgi:hypothetical protein